MKKQSSTIEVVEFIHRHLERRPEPKGGVWLSMKPVRRAEVFVQMCGAEIVIGGTQPAFDPESGLIFMPSRKFYWFARLHMLKATWCMIVLHEGVHWSGHRSRLGRPRHREPFDEIYRREELVAELGSAMLCHDLKITSTPTMPHARYLNSYLRSLPNAAVELDIALAKANEAVGYLHALARR